MSNCLRQHFEGYVLDYEVIKNSCEDVYGVMITGKSKDHIEITRCYNLTADPFAAAELAEYLSELQAMPATANDIVEDWLYTRRKTLLRPV